MTIQELLATKMYRNNQSFLARELGTNRGTLHKYMNDEAGEFHFIRKTRGVLGDKLELFTNQSYKITGK
jgi:hypothetical protein